MLSTVNEIVESIDVVNSSNGKVIKGRDCFRAFVMRHNRQWDKITNNENTEFNAFNISFFDQYGYEFAHYFRFLFNFFRFIDENEYAQKRHSRVLRSILSDYELILIFYNCNIGPGTNFRPFIEKYALFDNLPVSRLIDLEHLQYYPSSAFGGNSDYVKWESGNT
ncbi:putative phage abortive infection protein [uncultured Tateyamaria sp.]|uniref:putative phage abortive infection protein n=1 Tax=uncultured Tateyamaria sp. TaxID=455651 RepID=UPI0026213F21|nr:putative phage abortive infection protein [uncultured Tateyamaria sp.]